MRLFVADTDWVAAVTLTDPKRHKSETVFASVVRNRLFFVYLGFMIYFYG